jgi:hypothetical protein
MRGVVYGGAVEGDTGGRQREEDGEAAKAVSTAVFLTSRLFTNTSRRATALTARGDLAKISILT